MFFASTIGQIAHPFYVAFAWVLAFYYSLIHNYVFAIAMLTITVMVIVFPITQRGARSMMRMQLLSPELKKIQQKYKARPGDTPDEKAANRQALNTEMMALYREHGVSPTGGCLPMFLQFPIFLILYGVIEGLVYMNHGKPEPRYISHNSVLYHHIIAAHGALNAFGINLADNALTHGITVGARIAYIGLIVVAIVLQYVQMKQASGRNVGGAGGQMQQMQQLQKIFPLIFAVIYIRISAGVNIYFVVSSIFRIGQQEYLYRHDPQITEALEKLRARHKQQSDPKVLEAKAKIEANQPKGWRARLAAAAGIEPEQLEQRAKSARSGQPPARKNPPGKNPPGKNASSKATPAPRRAAAEKSSAAAAPARRNPPRQQGKRPRKPR